jgi:hypothetical protein
MMIPLTFPKGASYCDLPMKSLYAAPSQSSMPNISTLGIFPMTYLLYVLCFTFYFIVTHLWHHSRLRSFHAMPMSHYFFHDIINCALLCISCTCTVQWHHVSLYYDSPLIIFVTLIFFMTSYSFMTHYMLCFPFTLLLSSMTHNWLWGVSFHIPPFIFCLWLTILNSWATLLLILV